MLARAPICTPAPERPPIHTGQLWTARDCRRRGRYRVLWMSDCGQYARLVRTGSRGGWYITAERLHRQYKPLRRSA